MRSSRMSELDSRGRERRSLLGYLQFALSCVVAITAVVASVAADHDTARAVFAVTAVLIVVSIASSFVRWERIDRNWPIAVALFDLAVIAVLRDLLFDFQRGVTVLALIPIIWLAYRYGSAMVALAIAGNGVIALLPYFTRGGLPTNPSDWGNVIIAVSTGAVVAIAVQAVSVALRHQRVRFMNASHDLRLSVASGLEGDERLRAALRDAARSTDALRAREDALGTIGHDLRTPLTSIIGYLEVIEDAIDLRHAGIAREFEIVQRNSTRLLGLVDELLTPGANSAPLASPTPPARVEVEFEVAENGGMVLLRLPALVE